MEGVAMDCEYEAQFVRRAESIATLPREDLSRLYIRVMIDKEGPQHHTELAFRFCV